MGSGAMSVLFGALCLLLLHPGAHGFGILPGDSLNHLEITERALLNVTAQACRALALAEGADFSFPAEPFTAQGVAIACGAPQSSKTFCKAIMMINLRNVRVDLRHALNASFHFDDEMLVEGRSIITAGMEAVKASNIQENYEAAREKLGEICHPLQDFYSHSNWVELGNNFPNANLLRSDTSIGNIAEESRATCRSCDGADCRNNILEDIIEEQILTSGYFGIFPLSSTKPPGKCSHGGAVDQTSTIDPKGGINKDTFSASHGHLHTAAADIATAATSELLEEIRKAAGDRPFLKMMGLSKGSSKALCFVVDTTNSMRDDIAAVRSVGASIVNGEVGTEREPAAFILVPFNDPDVGPFIKTTNPEVLIEILNFIPITGGGDAGELSLSGLQLALSGAPFNSEIFLFTDAPAKDKELKSSVIALIERTHSVVNFMISGSTMSNHRRRRDANQQQHSRLAEADAELYRELAQVSGGLAAQVEKSDLPAAASIITETLNSSLVTLLQEARSPGKEEVFSFIVDETIINLTVYITGSDVRFTVTNPTGESQHSTDTSGLLIESLRSVGNLWSLQLQERTGLWEIRMVSTNPYTVKVLGQSPIDFLFDFVEESQGPFAGFDGLYSRPRPGINGSLLVSLTGSDTATVTEVVLVESTSSEEIQGVVEPQGSRNFLVHIEKIPSAEFGVLVKGQDDSFTSTSSKVFQRISRTKFRSSNLTVTVSTNGILIPGAPFSVPFSVMTYGEGGNFTVRASNNQHYSSTFPTSFLLESEKTTNSMVTLTAPRKTPTGTDVVLTIEVEAPGGGDTNYAVQRFTVINPVTDFIEPECQLLSMTSNCSDICNSTTWTVFLRVTDGVNGVGVDHVRLISGNGTLNVNLAAGNENETMVFYSSSCCSPDMELLVADRIGNVGTCYYTFRENASAPISGSWRVTQSPVLCLSVVVLMLSILARTSSDSMSI